MRQHQPTDHAAALARLAGDLDRLAHQVTDLTELQTEVAAHTRTLTDLTDLLRRLTTTSSSTAAGGAPAAGGGAGDQDGAPPEWLTVTDPAQAVAWLDGLHVWVRDVFARYLQTQLPVCWPWHPAAVNELLTLHTLWTTATAPGAAPAELGNWHDRWRPGVARRVATLLGACDRAFGSHHEPDQTKWIPDPTHLDEVAAWWATTHATSTRAPGLSPDTYR